MLAPVWAGNAVHLPGWDHEVEIVDRSACWTATSTASYCRSEPAVRLRQEFGDVADGVLARTPADSYPHLTEMIFAQTPRSGYDHAEEFEVGVELVLDALGAPPRPGSGTELHASMTGPVCRIVASRVPRTGRRCTR